MDGIGRFLFKILLLRGGGCVYKNFNLLLGGVIIIKDILGFCVVLYLVVGKIRWFLIK